MFGYVRPHKPELLVKELTRYQSVYCGICKQIGHDYGQLPRLALGYDLTLLGVLLLALAEQQPDLRMEGCIANPIKKRPILKVSPVLEHCAALTVLLAWYKAADNAHDESPIAGRGIQLLLQRAFHRASHRFPAYRQIIERQMNEMARIEDGPPDLAAAAVFGEMLKAILREAAPLGTDDPALQEGLALFGFHLGQWIYWLDAIDDRADDCNNESWNPFSLFTETEARAKAIELLTGQELAMDRVAALLPYRRDAGLLANIVTQGLPVIRDQVLAGQKLSRL
jgi:hypothetical protein